MASDLILVGDLVCPTRIGWSEEERSTSQNLLLDIEVSLDAESAARSEQIEDTINYSDIRQLALEIAGQRNWVLVESLALEIIRQTINTFRRADSCRVRVRKQRNGYWVGAELVRSREGVQD